MNDKDGIRKLAKLLKEMGGDRATAFPILVLADNLMIVDETIRYIKGNDEIDVNDVLAFVNKKIPDSAYEDN